MPESKNTNDTTDEAVEPVESTADATDEVVEKDVTGNATPEVEGELVDVPDELKEDSDSDDEDEDDDEADVPAAVGAGVQDKAGKTSDKTRDKTRDKKDKATKVADDKKPGKKAGKTVKPPRVKKAEKARKSGQAPRKSPKQRRWVAPLMLACWLIGLAWLVVFYVAGNDIPYMKDLNNWNLLIGMGLIAMGFVVSTQWV